MTKQIVAEVIMVAKTVAGYTSSLMQILEATDRSLPVGNLQELRNKLPNDGDWTTLMIHDTVGYEIVKAINFQGNIAIDRGLSGTSAKRFPVGSCVNFSVSDELLQKMACEVDCCENGVDDHYGDEATPPTTIANLEQLPKNIVGGVGAILGEPDGFMLINGKKVPYYNED